MDRVLLVDTNFSSAPIHDALEALGLEVFVCGGRPADSLARKSDRYVELDYSDPAAVSALARQLGLRAIVPGSNDLSYTVCAGLADEGLPAFTDPQATWITLNAKDAFRVYAQRLGLPVPAVFDPAGSLPQVPVIVKPSEAFSGRGIRVLHEPGAAALAEAIAAAAAVSRNGKVVVEEYVEGQLYSHSAFLRSGAIYADFFVEEHCTANPYAVDTSWVVEDLPAAIMATVRSAIETLSRDLGLRDGLVHTQFIRCGDGARLIEITRRCPGDRYGDLINLSTGFPYALHYALPLLGRVVEGVQDTRLCRRVLRHTLSGRTAMSFDAWACTRPLHILRYLPLCTSGEQLREGPQGRVGVVFLEESEARFAELAAAAVRRELFVFA